MKRIINKYFRGLFKKPDSAVYLIVIISAIFLSLVIWLPTRYDPFHWDSAGFLINAVKNLSDTNLNPLIVSFSDFSHPPVFIGFLALLWKFNYSPTLLMHLANLPLLPLLIISVYFLGRKLYSTPVAAAAAFLTGITPIIVAEYGQIYIDLPAATFIITSLAFWHNKKYRLGIFFFCAAILTKYTSLILFPLFFINYKKHIKNNHPYNLFLIPSLLIAGYISYHYLITGWLFARPGRHLATPQTLSTAYSSFVFVFSRVFLSQARWLASLPALTLLIHAFFKEKGKLHISRSTVFIGANLLLGVLLFSLVGEFAMRYGVMFYPLLYLLSLGLIDELSHKLNISHLALNSLAVIIIATGLLLSWHPQQEPTSEYEIRPPSDLSYRDMLIIFRKASSFLQHSHANSHIYGAFPENIYLTQTYQGYVTKPLTFDLCKDFIFNQEEKQIIIIHAYSNLQTNCRMILDEVPTTAISRYSEKSKWIELYEVTATPSADLIKES